MHRSRLWEKVQSKYRRTVSSWLFRRPFAVPHQQAYISFTFDDFPQSALLAGGTILQRHGLRGTYYAAFGIMGQDTLSGQIFTAEDLPALLAQGHELGCHTYAHCHSWATAPRAYEASILENRQALAQLVPGASFQSFSYPITCPRPFTKRRASRYFETCRGGGQTFNAGTVDLGNLRAFFLEKSRDQPADVKRLIDRNQAVRGWLVLATHDVAAQPTPFGCHPDYFEEIVGYAADSGSRILPVREVLAELRQGRAKDVPTP